MKTLYLDVYFLINFSVDLIVVYFAVIFSRIPPSMHRLLVGALLGALFACGAVFLSGMWYVVLLLAVICVWAITAVVAKGVGCYRKIKFTVLFFIFQFLMGGFVNYFFGASDKFLLPFLRESAVKAENGNLILLAIAVLLCIVVLKLISLLFASGCAEKSVSVEIFFRGRSIRFDAFCDSGNLAVDPMDSAPVVIVKKRAIAPLLPEIDEDFYKNPSSYANIDWSLKKRMRLLPIDKGGKSTLMLGIKADEVRVNNGKDGKYEPVSVTVAIDNEGGSYGGYDGLMPTAAICDVFK